MQARNNKNVKNLEPLVKVTITAGLNAEERNLAINEQGMDEGEEWAKSSTEKLSWDLDPKSRDYIDYSY